MSVLGELTEKQWSAQLAELAGLLGWRRYHTYRSERSAPGFPDEVLVRERIVYLELKTETGKLSPAQVGWLTALHQAAGEVYVARPRHFDELAAVLRRRSRPEGEYQVEADTLKELRVPAD